jgi:hypothetical protein
MEIHKDEKNYRVHDEKNQALIDKSLTELGAGRSILLDNSGKIIAGNGVFSKWDGRPIKIIETDGTELIAVKRKDLSPDDPRRQQLAFADNHTTDTSFFNEELLKEDFELLELSEWDFDTTDFFQEENEDLQQKREEAKKSLLERFIIPPFSILDTRQGYWQKRKEDWLDLGIKSEESRESMKVSGSYAGSVPRYYEMKAKAEKKLGRDLSNKEFEDNYLSDYIPKDSRLAYTDTGAILSIFDPVLCEIAYKWFCPNNGVIFDPIAGGSVRGIIAGFLGYQYTGIDLRNEQIEANYKQKELIIPNSKTDWICGNSIDSDELLPDLKADFIFSCPPYFDLEVYSDNKDDLSNLEWEEFKKQYAEIIKKSVDKLKDNSFACFVVGDVRDKKGFYRDFVGYTTECFEEAGAKLYNEMILVNVAGSLPIRITKQFNSYRKAGKCHQNVLVYFKGDPKTIKDKYPELDYSETEQEL